MVTSYASPVQCPPVLSGCSAAEATQGTVCEQTSGQSLAAVKESNQRSKGEQCGAIVPRQSQAELSWWGMHRATGSLAGGPGRAGQAGMQAEPPSAPLPWNLRLPIPAGLKPRGSSLCLGPHRCWHCSWSPQGGWALPKAGGKGRGQILWDRDVRALQVDMLCQWLTLPRTAFPSCMLGCPGERGPAQVSSQLRQTNTSVLALP